MITRINLGDKLSRSALPQKLKNILPQKANLSSSMDTLSLDLPKSKKLQVTQQNNSIGPCQEDFISVYLGFAC